METTFKFLISIIFITLVIKESCSCELNSLQIVQENTGALEQGKPVWKVSVINNCDCGQSQIFLSCKGFQSVVQIDPLVLKVQGDNCLLFNGHLLSYKDIDSFEYAWDTSFTFAPVSAVTSPPPCHSPK
ncbi:unnamed protein product [Vicia faba]|uniref:Uncharacterized protein n=1 Tax=Vicia faba TaxID=3906 RepID=A0AAV0ZWH9_VICFA|nr:unnamed protein product [Vicia faba]